MSLFFVIPLGLEPKTHSLEGCCSIQLSYGTIIAINGILPDFAGAKVTIFYETAKFYTLNLMYERSSKELLPSMNAFVALNSPMFSGSVSFCFASLASDSSRVGQRNG